MYLSRQMFFYAVGTSFLMKNFFIFLVVGIILAQFVTMSLEAEGFLYFILDFLLICLPFLAAYLYRIATLGQNSLTQKTGETAVLMVFLVFLAGFMVLDIFLYLADLSNFGIVAFLAWIIIFRKEQEKLLNSLYDNWFGKA